MLLKQGVSLVKATVILLDGLQAVDSVWLKHFDSDVTVTSGDDGVHKQGSLHYIGNAADLRIWALSYYAQRFICEELELVLGRDWNVVLEKDHIHIEYDPEIKHA